MIQPTGEAVKASLETPNKKNLNQLTLCMLFLAIKGIRENGTHVPRLRKEHKEDPCMSL